MDIAEYRLIRVAAKMWNEAATSVSDEETERCLERCVSKTRLIEFAKNLRDQGKLTIEYVRSL